MFVAKLQSYKQISEKLVQLLEGYESSSSLLYNPDFTWIQVDDLLDPLRKLQVQRRDIFQQTLKIMGDYLVILDPVKLKYLVDFLLIQQQLADLVLKIPEKDIFNKDVIKQIDLLRVQLSTDQFQLTQLMISGIPTDIQIIEKTEQNQYKSHPRRREYLSKDEANSFVSYITNKLWKHEDLSPSDPAKKTSQLQYEWLLETYPYSISYQKSQPSTISQTVINDFKYTFGVDSLVTAKQHWNSFIELLSKSEQSDGLSKDHSDIVQALLSIYGSSKFSSKSSTTMSPKDIIKDSLVTKLFSDELLNHIHLEIHVQQNDLDRQSYFDLKRPAQNMSDQDQQSVQSQQLIQNVTEVKVPNLYLLYWYYIIENEMKSTIQFIKQLNSNYECKIKIFISQGVVDMYEEILESNGEYSDYYILGNIKNFNYYIQSRQPLSNPTITSKYNDRSDNKQSSNNNRGDKFLYVQVFNPMAIYSSQILNLSPDKIGIAIPPLFPLNSESITYVQQNSDEMSQVEQYLYLQQLEQLNVHQDVSTNALLNILKFNQFQQKSNLDLNYAIQKALNRLPLGQLLLKTLFPKSYEMALQLGLKLLLPTFSNKALADLILPWSVEVIVKFGLEILLDYLQSKSVNILPVSILDTLLIKQYWFQTKLNRQLKSSTQSIDQQIIQRIEVDQQLLKKLPQSQKVSLIQMLNSFFFPKKFGELLQSDYLGKQAINMNHQIPSYVDLQFLIPHYSRKSSQRRQSKFSNLQIISSFTDTIYNYFAYTLQNPSLHFKSLMQLQKLSETSDIKNIQPLQIGEDFYLSTLDILILFYYSQIKLQIVQWKQGSLNMVTITDPLKQSTQLKLNIKFSFDAISREQEPDPYNNLYGYYKSVSELLNLDSPLEILKKQDSDSVQLEVVVKHKKSKQLSKEQAKVKGSQLEVSTDNGDKSIKDDEKETARPKSLQAAIDDNVTLYAAPPIEVNFDDLNQQVQQAQEETKQVQKSKKDSQKRRKRDKKLTVNPKVASKKETQNYLKSVEKVNEILKKAGELDVDTKQVEELIYNGFSREEATLLLLGQMTNKQMQQLIQKNFKDEATAKFYQYYGRTARWAVEQQQRDSVKNWKQLVSQTSGSIIEQLNEAYMLEFENPAQDLLPMDFDKLSKDKQVDILTSEFTSSAIYQALGKREPKQYASVFKQNYLGKTSDNKILRGHLAENYYSIIVDLSQYTSYFLKDKVFSVNLETLENWFPNYRYNQIINRENQGQVQTFISKIVDYKQIAGLVFQLTIKCDPCYSLSDSSLKDSKYDLILQKFKEDMINKNAVLILAHLGSPYWHKDRFFYTGQKEISQFIKEVSQNLRENTYGTGTLQGNLSRYSDCVWQHQRLVNEFKQDPNQVKYVNFMPTSNVIPHRFSDDNITYQLLNDPMIGYNIGSSQGNFCWAKVRSRQAVIQEINLFIEFLYGIDNPDTFKEISQLAFIVDMKPKKEFYPKAKEYKKSRLIFSPNTFTQLGLQVMLANLRPAYEGGLHSVSDNLYQFLGSDPSVLLKTLIQVPLKSDLEDYPYLWLCYSDNMYCLDSKEHILYSFDGAKMESSITQGVIDKLLETFEPNSQLEIFLKGMKAKDVEKDIVEALQQDLTCQSFCLPSIVTTQTYDYFLDQLGSDLKLDNIEDDEFDGSKGCFLTLLVQNQQDQVFKDNSNRYNKYLSLYLDYIDKMFGSYQGQSFRVPFLASGAQFTSEANTIVSLSVSKYWIDNRITPQQIISQIQDQVKAQQNLANNDELFQYCSFITYSGSTDISRNYFSTGYHVADFLGLDILHQQIQGFQIKSSILRKETLYTGIMFYTARAKSGSNEAINSQFSKIISYIILGGVMDIAFMTFCAYQLAILPAKGLDYMSIVDEDIDIIQQALADKGHFWMNIFQGSIKRCVLNHSEKLDDFLMSVYVNKLVTLFQIHGVSDFEDLVVLSRQSKGAIELLYRLELPTDQTIEQIKDIVIRQFNKDKEIYELDDHQQKSLFDQAIKYYNQLQDED